ncbi:ArgP/LysG family DNA-binding transcriptional regulator [Mesorhizobium sp. A623]
MIDIKDLTSLRALASNGSFEAAARALKITPGAMSQRIKQIEDRIGQVVAVRASPTRLTQAGETLLRLALQVDILFEDTIQILTGKDAIPSLTVAVNHDSLATWFVAAVAKFSSVSSATVEVRCVDQALTSSLLRDGSAVAAISAEDVPPQGCETVSLGCLEYVAVCSPEFATKWLGSGDTEGTRDNCPMVIFEHSDSLSRRIAGEMVDKMGTPRMHFLPDANAMLKAAVHGIGWAVVPKMLASEAVISGKLVEIATRSQMEVPLYFHHWRLGGQTLDVLVDCICESAAAYLKKSAVNLVGDQLLSFAAH